MSCRNRLALQAIDELHLTRLSELLYAAVRECLQDGEAPPGDPAIQLICRQIAFAGNGDLESGEYYQSLVKYCKVNGTEEPPTLPKEIVQ